jgi:hypothetical protein
MPELQKALLDPLPEVRATAARAMGSLLKGMGPAALGDLLPWLLTTLRSEGSSVERSGAAQVGGWLWWWWAQQHWETCLRGYRQHCAVSAAAWSNHEQHLLVKDFAGSC